MPGCCTGPACSPTRSWPGCSTRWTELAADVRSGAFAPLPADEDVHTALERGLMERAGAELGGRLRAGRSRNDQIATLIRMYLREQARRAVRAGRRPDRRARRSGRTASGRRDARPHPSAARPAGAAGPPPARALLAAAARPATVARLGRRAARQPVRLRRAGRQLARAGSGRRWRPSWASPAAAENSIDATAARDVVAEFSFVTTMIGGGPVPAGRGDHPLGDQGVLLRHPRRRATPPAPRSCRRRRTRTSPSWPGARPAG